MIRGLRALIGRWPFLTLAAVTLLVGVVWHAVSGGTRSGAAFAIVSILGAPFIGAMRFATRTLGMSPPFSQIAGLVLGVTPYLVAEVALRVVRTRRLSSGA